MAKQFAFKRNYPSWLKLSSAVALSLAAVAFPVCSISLLKALSLLFRSECGVSNSTSCPASNTSNHGQTNENKRELLPDSTLVRCRNDNSYLSKREFNNGDKVVTDVAL